jgi:hypothetical protein
MYTRSFHVGDRLISVLADLYNPDGSPVVLGVAETVTFRMVLISDGSVKVNNAAATVVTAGSLATRTPAQVRYDWAVGDVDTAGEYSAWFIRTSAGSTEHFPIQDHSDPQFKIIFEADS